MRFVLLFRNDPVAAGLMLANGEAGVGFLKETIEEFGGLVDHIVPVLGRYDAVIVCKFPSQASIMAFSLSATSSGQYVEAMLAGDDGDLDVALEIARTVAQTQRTQEVTARESESQAVPSAKPDTT